jgi:hypothetical protein
MPRLATRPRIGRLSRSPPLLDLLARLRRIFTIRSRLGRELILIGVALLIGFVVVPLAIWLVGNRILGPYSHGSNPHAGPMALLGDFFAGLSLGWVSFWVVALGPLAIIQLGRLAWLLINPNPRQRPPNPGVSVNKSNARIEPRM